jgi:hypothetical protein
MKPNPSDASLCVRLTLATGIDHFLVCCPGGTIGLSPGFQPWELAHQAIRPEGARDHLHGGRILLPSSGALVVVAVVPGVETPG